MLEYVTGYLKSNVTPGQAGNYLWALIYILLIFAGVSVAVIAMNWLERKILAHMQVRLGPMRVVGHPELRHQVEEAVLSRRRLEGRCGGKRRQGQRRSQQTQHIAPRGIESHRPSSPFLKVVARPVRTRRRPAGHGVSAAPSTHPD